MTLPSPSPSALSSGSPAEAWRRLVLLTNPDFTEAELLSLSLPTLQGLLPAYGVRSPVDAAHVELAWRERQRQRGASAGEDAGAAAAPPISELPPPASVASASVSASPRYVGGGGGGGAAAATEVLVHRQAGEPLGLVFRGDSLLLVGCPDDSPAARCGNLGSLVGARLSHVDGRPVRSQGEARALLEQSTAALLGFSPPTPSDDGGGAGAAVDAGDELQPPQPLHCPPQAPSVETVPFGTSLPPSSPPFLATVVEAEAPAAAAAAAAADGGDVRPPPLPYPFNVDALGGGGVPAAVAPGGEAAAASSSEDALLLLQRQRQQQQRRRANSPATLRRAVHPKPFEVPLTPRTAKLSRRRRLATDEPGISDPNVAAALPLEPGGKLCKFGGGGGGGGGGGMAWGGGDFCDRDDRPPRISKRPLRTKSPASGNPNASAHAADAAASRQPSGKARGGGEPRPSAVGNPNNMGAEAAEAAAAAAATGRYRPPLSELQVHATGNPNVTMGTCDPFAREMLEFPRDCNGFYSTIKARGRLPSEPAAHSNPNDAGTQRPAAPQLGRRSAAAGWDAAEGHGPPGVWPEGGPEDRGAGLRCVDEGGGGVMPGAHGWGADDEDNDAQQRLPPSLGLRFAAPKGGKGAAAAHARVEADDIGGARRRRCPSPDWGAKLSGAGAGVRRTPSAGGAVRGRTAGVRNMAAVPTAPADHIGPDWSLSDRSGGGLRFIGSK